MTDDYTPPTTRAMVPPPPSDPVLWVERPTPAGTIWKRKYWIVLLALLAGAGTYYGARVPSPTYTSSAVIQVTMQQTTGTPNETLLAANGLAAQYAQLATTTAVIYAAAKAIDSPPSDLAHSVSANTVSQLNLVKVSSTGGTPAESQQRANATANALKAIIVANNRTTATAFLRKASSAGTATNRQIASLQTQIAKASQALAKATTESGRAQQQTLLQGLQGTYTSLLAQRNSSTSNLALDAALAQPDVAVVTQAGPGSRSQLSPVAFGLIGTLAGAIVFGQLFVLAGARRQTIRPVVPGEHPSSW